MPPQAVQVTAPADMDTGDDSTGSKEPGRGGKGDKHDDRQSVSCFQALALKLNLLEKDATPPNWKYILLVFTALFSSCCSLTYLFPFLPEMILFLGYEETDKGKYAGMIAGSIFAGRAVGSIFWGWLADRKGRKIVLLITIALNGIFSGLFGFADSLYAAILIRFICGLVNGTVGTSKAILYDVSDNSNQAISMTMLALAWGSGLICGPMMGGVLASPATHWPEIFSHDGLFGQFPFLLPSLFPFLVCFAVFFVILLYFDETLVTPHKRETLEADVEDAKSNQANNYLFGAEEDKRAGAEGETFLLTQSPMGNPHPHRSAPHLTGSFVSLAPEAEMSVCLGRKAVERQESVDLIEIHCLTKSEPNLIYKLSDKRRTLPSMEGLRLNDISHSVDHVRQQPSSLSQTPASEEKTRVNGHLPVGEESVRGNGHVLTQHDQNTPLLLSNENHTSSNKPTRVYQRSVSYDQKITSELSSLRPDKDKLNAETELLAGHRYEEDARESSKEEDVCKCADWCCKLSCCWMCVNSGLHKLLRLSDVWATIMLYSVVSFATIALDDIFPVFASTDPGYGGLGFTSSQIGVALGVVTMPLLILQVKIYPFLAKHIGIRKTFILSSFICLLCGQLLPLIRLLKHTPTGLWVAMIIVQIPLKIATNCCFASTSLLINNSVWPELAGQANGLAMTCTAIGRTIAPIVGGLLFSWCVTYGPEVGLPFDISFPFFAVSFTYVITCVQCLFIKPSLDKQKK